MFKNLYVQKGRRARIGQCMSGSGTNVRKVLDQEIEMGDDCPYETSVIFTDDKRSNAKHIVDEYSPRLSYNIGFVELDIRDHQVSKGLTRKLSLATEKHREAREEYTAELTGILKNHNIDFLVFGGFEPLTNITEEFLCLNVHPGDLTYLKDGERYLVGLYTVPIQRAIDEGIGYVRSSVIQAMPYTGAGENMDDGPILGLGPKLFYEDERDTKKIQNALKVVSDWKIFPAVVLDVAHGKIEVDYETNKVKNRIVMDSEFKISEVDIK